MSSTCQKLGKKEKSGGVSASDMNGRTVFCSVVKNKIDGVSRALRDRNSIIVSSAGALAAEVQT